MEQKLLQLARWAPCRCRLIRSWRRRAFSGESQVEARKYSSRCSFSGRFTAARLGISRNIRFRARVRMGGWGGKEGRELGGEAGGGGWGREVGGVSPPHRWRSPQRDRRFWGPNPRLAGRCGPS